MERRRAQPDFQHHAALPKRPVPVRYRRKRESRHPTVQTRGGDGRQHRSHPWQRCGIFLPHHRRRATEGCVAIDDDTLVQIIRWLQPGALMAIGQ
ncbi:putative conserved exported protein [Mycobacterium xenopi 3993]|nr:putative conserved exported protein [Mycobacterium xenopi 3993]